MRHLIIQTNHNMFLRAPRILSAPVLRRHQVQRIAHARKRLSTSAEKSAEKEASDEGRGSDWWLVARVSLYIASFAGPWSFLTQIRDDLEFRYYMEDKHPGMLRRIESLFPGYVPPIPGYEYTLVDKPQDSVEIVVQRNDKEEWRSPVDASAKVKDIIASFSLDGSHSIHTSPSTFSFGDPVQWIHHIADNPHIYACGASMSKDQLKEYVSQMESRVTSAHERLTTLQRQNAEGLTDQVEVNIAQKDLEEIVKKYQRYQDMLKRWDAKPHWKPESTKRKKKDVDAAATASSKASSFSLFSYFSSEPKAETKVEEVKTVAEDTMNPHMDSEKVLEKFVQREKALRQNSLYPYGPEVDEGIPALFSHPSSTQLITTEQQELLARYVLKKVDERINGPSNDKAVEDQPDKGTIAVTAKSRTLGDLFEEGRKLSMKNLKAGEVEQQTKDAQNTDAKKE